jgi:RHH-type transcriptional regulator, proline utilization regulon repressor / proline dehydrogenase / delta 1-pyrroline-5-carboxylate dehydrogenase
MDDQAAPVALDETTDARALELGHELFSRARHPRQPKFPILKPWQKLLADTRFDDWLMDFTMRDPRLKAQLFRFIDVLPVLESPTQINQHLIEYLWPVRDRLPGGVALELLPRDGMSGRLLASITRQGARRMARRFIAGSNLRQAAQSILALRRRKLAFTIDLLGEAVLSEEEALRYQQAYLDLIDGLADRAKFWPPVERADFDHDGAMPTVNVSVKLSSLYSQFDPIDPVDTSRAVRDRLRPILRRTRQRGAFVNIDMEQYAYKDATLRIFREAFEEEEFRDWANVGIAIQAYLRDTPGDLTELASWAKKRGKPIWVRLVKGAYWDYESVIAAQNDWPQPVWSQKPQTDAMFEAMTTFLMEHRQHLRPAIASHNIRSIAHALAEAQRLRLPPRSFEFQMLYGMADPIKSALVEMGQRVRVYTPFGELLPGMAYLVRRLLENTSNESFLRAGFHEKRPEEQLLMNPLDILRTRKSAHVEPGNGNGRARLQAEFRNEPLADFSKEENRRAMTEALQAVPAQITCPLIINGSKIESGRWIESRNPSHSQQIVGKAASATVEQANAAVAAAKAAFPAWRDTPPQQRAALLMRAAQVLRRRRWELSAIEVLETAKQWREADADVAEAIDYCEYYAREMLRLAVPRHRDVPGEENAYFYEPRGVAVTIAPWNFPLAILCGMTTAALVSGNTVVMKPAEQSPIIAGKLMEVFEEAGFSPGVMNYLPGVGEEIGPTLVQHPDVATIAFTGSRAVGLLIQRQAAEVSAGQDHIKRVITELGGKNAVIVDEDADLDEAVHGVVASAFGYAGQKCSACSRAIVLPALYESFLARLIDATRSLRIGPAEDPSAFVGPVIDEEAKKRILAMIERGKTEAKLVYIAQFGAMNGGDPSSPSPGTPGEGWGGGNPSAERRVLSAECSQLPLSTQHPALSTSPQTLTLTLPRSTGGGDKTQTSDDLSSQGYYVPPTIFADVPESACIAQEEIFGPVLAVMRATDLTDALRIANGTRYALTGGLFSRSPRNIERVRAEFRVGNLYINRKITGALVDRQPFGGFKLSGVGSKAGGPDYLLQFMLPRTITENTLRHGFAPENPQPHGQSPAGE